MSFETEILVLVFFGSLTVSSCYSVTTDRRLSGVREPDLSKPLPVLIPSTVLTCSSQFTRHIVHQLAVLESESSSTTELAHSTNEVIEILCGFNYHFGASFVSCIQLDLPLSTYTIDKLLMLAFNRTTLPHILYGGCNITSELNSSMECIISSITSNQQTMKCLTDVGTFFEKLAISNFTTLDSSFLEFCRVWGSMVSCVYPHIGFCNQDLSSKWLLYGREILTPQCEAFAFPFEGLDKSDPAQTIHDTYEVFYSNLSAVSTCAERSNQDVHQLLPTFLIDPIGYSNNTIMGFNSFCNHEVQQFLYCMDEMRLNSTSSIDHFIFNVISTVNMRLVYNRMCSQLEVLRTNANCLVNPSMEFEACICNMEEVIFKVKQMTSRPGEVVYDLMVDPFCSSYISFAKCYIGLVSICSHDLGRLMEEIYFGSLTLTCLESKPGSCSQQQSYQNENLPSSVFFQCGTKVARFVSQVTMETNVTSEIDEMMTSMEDLVIQAYNFTCSIGEEILECLGDKFATSKNEFDQLLLQMFDTSKFISILTEGCNPSLLNDVKSRLQYILSMILSDPRLSTCIEALNGFTNIFNEEVDMPNFMDPYCRIWADFSKCIESKLSCSSSDLARTWRQFTIESLNADCQAPALNQQEINPVSMCNINGMDDSALSLCGMSFMASYMARSNEVADRSLDEVIMDEIFYFCKDNMDEALIMIDCLRSTLFSSSMKIDSVVRRIFDLSILEEIAEKICSVVKDTANPIQCFIHSMEVSGDTEICPNYLKEGFNTTVYQYMDLEQLTNMGCRGWKDFTNCVLPHINACDIDLSRVWSNLSHIVITDDCQTYIAKTARQRAGSSAVQVVYNIPMILLSFITSFFVFLV